MYSISNGKGYYVPGCGGDKRLFTVDDARAFIRDMTSKNREWATDGAIVELYEPNVLHLDAIEFLEDKGFHISVKEGGNSIVVCCDTLWASPMVDLLYSTLFSEHLANRDSGFKIVFQNSKQIVLDSLELDDHALEFEVLYDYNEVRYAPSIWREKFKMDKNG
tara:strand:- start:8 stop:496 length:489 start_codon:yes stop_codon:yes gene_type:complete